MTVAAWLGASPSLVGRVIENIWTMGVGTSEKDAA